MPAAEIRIETSAGTFAGIDYGGSGPDCLLIHGTGQNALAWQDFAGDFTRIYRAVAFDMRGHGQTPENSVGPEQYWRDVRAVAEALGMPEPILIGHSTGAYAAMAHVAAGQPARAVVCIDGFTLDDQPPLTGDWAAASTMLFKLFRYGWEATEAERNAFIEQCIEAAPDDPFNTGIEPSLLRAMLLRCFVRRDGSWTRRPTLEEIKVVSSPPAGASIAPNRGIYDRIEAPMLMVWARHGLSAGRRDEVAAIASAGRSLVDIDASHNVPMQRPVELARVVSSYLDGLASS